MKLSLEQFRELLVDYLYGSLEGADLRAFEECLAESEVCRRELAAMQGTLRTAREALATASDPPPARVRAAVLAVAATVAQERKAERKSQRASSRPPLLKPARAPAEGETRGGWSWLRASWLVPTLGVAAAVSVVVFSRDVESPNMHRDEAAAHAPRAEAPVAPAQGSEVAPAAPEAPAAPSPQQDAVETAARGAAPESKAAPDVEREHAKGEGTPAAAPAPAKRGYARPPAYWEALAGHEEKSSANAAATPGSQRDDRADELATESPRDGAPASGGGGASRRSEARREQAEDSSSLGGVVRSRAASAPTRAAAPSPAEVMRQRDAVASPADAALTRDALVKRAQEQTLGRAWAAVVASYGELLRRFPTDTQVPVWRKQLAAATEALAATQ